MCVHRLGDELQKSESAYIPRSSPKNLTFMQYRTAWRGDPPLLLPLSQRGDISSPLTYSKCQGNHL